MPRHFQRKWPRQKQEKIESVLHIRKRVQNKRMSKNLNDCRNIEVIEGKNKYTLTCSTMDDKDKRRKIVSNQITNNYRLKTQNFNCKYFKNRVCFNKLCKQLSFLFKQMPLIYQRLYCTKKI